MATISVLTSRKLVYVDLSVWERAGSGNTSTNKSIVEYSVVIKKGSVSWNTSWASWGQKIYATYAIDGLGTKTVYVPTYNYGGTCPPGTVIASGSFEIEHDSLGNKTIGFSLSFTDNANGYNTKDDGTKSYYTPGSASTVYGSVALANIPRYFSSTPTFTFKDKTETQIRYDWSTTEECDSISVSGSGTKSITGLPGKSGVITITGLSAYTNYTHTATFRRKDSQLSSDGPSRTYGTYNYPYVTSAPNFTIGNVLSIQLYNPLKRNCTVHLINAAGTELGGDSTTGTDISGYTGESVQNFFYAGIPSAQSGKYKVRLKVESPSRDTTVDGGTYYIKGTEVPTFVDANITNVVDTLHADDITGLNTKIIKGHNKVTGTIVPMVANNKASGKRYIVSANANPSSQEISYATTNKTFTFENITVNSFTITAYDTRELSTARNKNIDLVDYAKPKVNNFTITRQNGIGEYAILTADGTNTYWNGWSQIKKYNTIQKVYYRYKPSGSSTWSIDWTDITTSLTTNANGSWRLSRTLDIIFTTTTKYDFQIYVQDVLESSDVKSNTLSTANGFLWRDLKNKFLGINKKPEYELDVNGTIRGNKIYGTHTDYDYRDVNESPIEIMERGRGVTFDFKSNSVIGNSFSTLYYSLVTNLSPWGDKSGGRPTQISSDTSGIRFRHAADDNTWGSWYDLGLLAYPVGSIYMSVSPTNPKNLFGGTWEQLKNAFLFATNATSGTKGTGSGTGTSTGANNGNTGSTTLSAEQSGLPRHMHEVQQRRNSPTAVASFYNTNTTAGQQEYGLTNSAKMVNTGSNDNLFTSYTGGSAASQGHTHTLGNHSHSVPYLEVYVWKRTG